MTMSLIPVAPSVATPHMGFSLSKLAARPIPASVGFSILRGRRGSDLESALEMSMRKTSELGLPLLFMPPAMRTVGPFSWMLQKLRWKEDTPELGMYE